VAGRHGRDIAAGHFGRHPAALREAQEILIRSGAVSYGLYQLPARERTAREQLAALDLMDTAGLSALLDELIAPVITLLAAV